MRLLLFAQRLFGIRAAERTGQIHPVAHGDPVYALAHSLDYAGPVRTGRERGRRFGIDAGPNIGLNRIDADRVHAHHDLPRLRGQVRDFFELQYLRFTKLVYPNSFHSVYSLPRQFAIIQQLADDGSQVRPAFPQRSSSSRAACPLFSRSRLLSDPDISSQQKRRSGHPSPPVEQQWRLRWRG